MEDTEVGGVPVKKGEMLMLAYSVGCRDPRVHTDPNEIDIRRPVKGNLAFGFGPHRCPGNHIEIAAVSAFEKINSFGRHCNRHRSRLGIRSG